MTSISKLAGAVAAALLMAGAAAAQPAERPGPPTFDAPLSNQKPAHVPAEMVEGQMPIVEVRLNGKGPYRFAIDSGALGHALVTQALATELGLPVAGEIKISDPSGRNARTMTRHTLALLALGDAEFRDLDVTASVPAEAASRRNVHGILGIDLFRDYKLTLDYAGGTVSIDKSRLPATGKGIVAYDRADGFINLPVMVGKREMRLHLDTGNSTGALSLPEPEARSLTLKGEPRVVGRARTVSNEFEIFAADIADEAFLGGEKLNVGAVGYPVPAPVGNLGSRAFWGMKIEIDQPSSRIRVSRP